MKDKIEHKGIIEHIDDKIITVRIESSESSCDLCQARTSCAAAGGGAKSITVGNMSAGSLSVGDCVTVTGHSGMSRLAVVLAFVTPVILVVAAVALGEALSANEGVGAISGLIVLMLYYSILYLLRNKLSKRFVFRISET